MAGNREIPPLTHTNLPIFPVEGRLRFLIRTSAAPIATPTAIHPHFHHNAAGSSPPPQDTFGDKISRHKAHTGDRKSSASDIKKWSKNKKVPVSRSRFYRRSGHKTRPGTLASTTPQPHRKGHGSPRRVAKVAFRAPPMSLQTFPAWRYHPCTNYGARLLGPRRIHKMQMHP